MKFLKELLSKVKSIFTRTQKELETEIIEAVKEEVLEEVVVLIKDLAITPKLKETLLENNVKTLEDLKEVELTDIPGIGPKKAEALKKLIP